VPIAQAVAVLNAKAAQCDSLIANAHRMDAAGAHLFPQLDREQITIAAFLNLFVAWEEFLEALFSSFLTGAPTLSGSMPVKHASPPNADIAKGMLIGTNRYFDYANHDNVRKMASIYFQDGYPFEAPLSAVFSDLGDLRTMRNASAHISSTTQRALEALAQRIFGVPRLGISLYVMLTEIDPRSAQANTVYAEARQKLLVTAQLIAHG
jgi:hypothetical protein